MRFKHTVSENKVKALLVCILAPPGCLSRHMLKCYLRLYCSDLDCPCQPIKNCQTDRLEQGAAPSKLEGEKLVSKRTAELIYSLLANADRRQ